MLRVTEPYEKRRLRYLSLDRIGDWRIKLYSITRPGREPRRVFLDATLANAAHCLPTPATGDERYGLGFAIAHEGRTHCMANIYWWQNENELHQRLFAGPLAKPAALAAIADPAAGCVWELGIIDFERRSWHADILSNPSGPDVERYLSRQLDVDF
jgi:hypothetical protein